MSGAREPARVLQMESLREVLATGDVELEVEGQGLRAHRLVLELASPVLRDLLASCEGARLGREPLKVDGSLKVWERILGCLYHSMAGGDAGLPALSRGDIEIITAMLPVLHKYDFTVLLKSCIRVACVAVQALAPPGYDFCVHGRARGRGPEAARVNPCLEGCTLLAGFHYCSHKASYGHCKGSPDCAHAGLCANSRKWGSDCHCPCPARHKRPADPNGPGATGRAVEQQLLQLFRLSVNLELDPLFRACNERLSCMDRRQLADVLDGRWGELKGLGDEGQMLHQRVVASLRS